MKRRYHLEIIMDTLGDFFTVASLREIWRANVGQDSIRSMFGYESRRHACDCELAESLAYIEEERSLIADLCSVEGSEKRQRAAFGRLLHTVHDIYAHTTYVALWVSQSEMADGQHGTPMDGLDPAITENPALQVASWETWREPFYYIPLLGRLMRCLGVPAGSHEAINLDSPRRGSNFHLAMEIARQRTLHEYSRTVTMIREIAGGSAVARFHGIVVGTKEVVHPLIQVDWPGIVPLARSDTSIVIDSLE